MSPGRCFVNGCHSHKCEEKISLFSAPKDPDVRKLWNDILKHPTKNLEPSHCVCERHFETNDVVKSLNVNGITLPNKISRLKKGSLPLPPSLKHEVLELAEVKTEPENIFDDAFSEDTKTMPPFVNIVSDAFLKNSSKIEETADIIDVKQEADMEFDNFFNELFENKYIFGLTQYWGIHSCEPKMPPARPCMALLLKNNKPRSIIFSQVNTRDGFPLYEKQVIINEQLEMSYFVAHVMVDLGLPKTCRSLEELCNAINKYAEFIICPGVPSTEEYKELIHVTNCAYKDASSRTWRHKNCIFFTQREMQPCLYCHALPKYFKTTLKKSKKLKRLKKDMGSNVEERPKITRKKKLC